MKGLRLLLLSVGFACALATAETQTKDFVGSGAQIECITPTLDLKITGVTYALWDVQASVVSMIDLPSKILDGFLAVEERPPAQILQRC